MVGGRRRAADAVEGLTPDVLVLGTGREAAARPRRGFIATFSPPQPEPTERYVPAFGLDFGPLTPPDRN
jgi:hypothetical protein